MISKDSRVEIFANSEMIAFLKDKINDWLKREDIDIESIDYDGGLVYIIYTPKK